MAALDPPVLFEAVKFRRRVLSFYALSFVTAAIAVLFYGPKPLQMGTFDIDTITRIFGPLIAVSAFMERALEVLVGGLRDGMKARLVEEIKDPAPGADLKTLKLQLKEYEHRTMRIAFVTLVAFGLVVSVLGVRSLEPLLRAGSWKGIASAQQSGFRLLDVIITAGMLGGGSAGLHKLTNLLTDYLDKASDNVKKGS